MFPQNKITFMTDLRKFGITVIVAPAADDKYKAPKIANILQIGVRTLFDAMKKVSDPDESPRGNGEGAGRRI
jgi:hypothetical protein